MDFGKLKDAVDESNEVAMYMVHIGPTKLTTISPTIEPKLRGDIKQIIYSNLEKYSHCTAENYNLIGSALAVCTCILNYICN